MSLWPGDCNKDPQEVGMSLRKKVLLIALGAALAIVAGNNLTAFKNAVSTVASAVWGS